MNGEALVSGLSGLRSRLDFSALLTQDTRLLKLHWSSPGRALPELALVPERLVLREALSQPYELTLDALSSSRHLALKGLIGQELTVELLGSDGAYHPWHGHVFEAAQLGGDGGLARYRLTLRPWLALLGLRRDARVFQGLCAQQVIERVFAGHAQAEFAFQLAAPLRARSLCVQYHESDLDFVQRLLAEEGLSYHFEQLGPGADTAGRAHHRLVVTDAQTARPDLGDVRFTSAHDTAWQAGQRDAVTAFAATRRVAANAVTLGAWDYKQLHAPGASAATALAIGELPTLEHYDGSGAYRYPDDAGAQAAADRALQALELGYKRYEGDASARHFRAGASFTLSEHALFGGLPGVPIPRDDPRFTLLAVEHHVANNLGAGMAELLHRPDIEQGGYRNHFHAVPAAALLRPVFVRKPTAPGLQSALVVGLGGDALTTERDLRVKVQFPWQRGERPLAGGLGAPDDAGHHHAPGDERSGTWVRVGQPSAGANWGSVFVPRIGTEVAVQFIEGDIDRPVIAGQLYNGQDRPPFAAGVDSGVNHPGVISGLQSRGLDGQGGNRWILDDATGQLRTSLHCAYANAELALGHLIAQDQGAWRGAWRGAGWLATTQGWATLRAGAGLLVTSAARAGCYGSAEGTQMDAAEALAQLNAGRELGQRLGQAAQAGRAQALPSHDEAQALDQAAQAMDPQRDGRHPGPVNGQSEFKPTDGRTPGSEPVEAFARPQIALHSASAQAWASPGSLMGWSGQNTSWVTQGELHQAAAHTYAQVSGKGTSLYTHAGGARLIAANGPLSIRAHTDALQLWADQSITVVSVNDEIRIQAQSRIELIGGHSRLLLDGGDITFTCPGKFEVKGGLHAFEGGGSQAASPPCLPDSRATLFHEQFVARNSMSGLPVAGMPYRIELGDGEEITGVTGADGKTEVVSTTDPKSLKLYWMPLAEDDFLSDAGSSEAC